MMIKVAARALLMVAALVPTMALSVLSAQESDPSIKGSFAGSETNIFQGDPPTRMFVDGSVSGLATYLGKFTLSYKFDVNLANGNGVGSAQLVAQNGDTLYTKITAVGGPVPSPPAINQVTESHKINGGTGKFAGARGTFVLVRLVTAGPGAPGETSGSFEGLINLRPAKGR